MKLSEIQVSSKATKVSLNYQKTIRTSRKHPEQPLSPQQEQDMFSMGNPELLENGQTTWRNSKQPEGSGESYWALEIPLLGPPKLFPDQRGHSGCTEVIQFKLSTFRIRKGHSRTPLALRCSWKYRQPLKGYQNKYGFKCTIL